jgi:hypothetical protein
LEFVILRWPPQAALEGGRLHILNRPLTIRAQILPDSTSRIVACGKLSYNPCTVCCREGHITMLGHLVLCRVETERRQPVLSAPAEPGLMRRLLSALFRRR